MQYEHTHRSVDFEAYFTFSARPFCIDKRAKVLQIPAFGLIMTYDAAAERDIEFIFLFSRASETR
jgi:hypothetical protein